MSRLLIVYYSWSCGNTERIAKRLQQAAGAELVRIETVTPYTGTYDQVVEEGQRQVERGDRPAIQPLGVNVSDYDTVAIGTPTWWYTMAPAVLTFLSGTDWAGRTVIPFQTHGGWPGHVIQDIKTACPGAQFDHEMEIRFDSDGGDRLETAESDIEAWVSAVARQYGT